MVVIHLTVGKVAVRPRIIGKFATVLQMAVVIWILLKWNQDLNPLWLKYLMAGAAICTGVSGLLYIWDGVKQLGSHPASSPATKNADNMRMIYRKLWQKIQLKLKEGDIAPEFSAATSGGGKISLADFKGKNVILYFYPKDDTPGCTKEACAFRDHFAEFKKARRGRPRRQHRFR